MKEPQNFTPKHAFTLTEMFVVIGLTVVLIALTLPVLSRAQSRSRQMLCLQQIRTYGNALLAMLSEKKGVPWWDGNGGAAMDPAATSPSFNVWLKDGGYLTERLRCPNATPEDRLRTYGMHYAANSSLNIYYSKNPLLIPSPHHRTVLASESYGSDHFNIAGHLNRTIWANNDGGASATSEGTATLWPNPQYHGSADQRGLHFFFMDGHAELITPVSNDWRRAPIFGDATNQGYIYDRDQVRRIHAGVLQIQ